MPAANLNKAVTDLTAFLTKQIRSCKSLVEENLEFALLEAQQLYLHRMNAFVRSSTKYIKYSDLKREHKRAIADARRVSKLAPTDTRLKAFADEHFEDFRQLNDARYKGVFMSPAKPSPKVVVKVFHKLRIGLRYPETSIGGRDANDGLMQAIGAKRESEYDAPYICFEEPVSVLDKLERYGYVVVASTTCHSCDVPGHYYYTWTLRKQFCTQIIAN